MNELWVARDKSGDLTLWRKKPECYSGVFDMRGRDPLFGYRELDLSWVPDLKPGQCRRLVLAEGTT